MARSFNGSSDQCSGTANITAAVTNITMSAWVYPLSSNSLGAIFFNGYDDGHSGYGYGIVQYYNHWAILLSGVAFIDSGVGFTTATWTHIAIANDGSNWLTYVNGSLVNTNGSTANAPTGFVWTAGYQASAGRYFYGHIAELGFWNTALKQGEITALASGARPCRVRPASLAGYWPLFGLQSPEPDLSGNSNNGTLTGTSYATHAPVTQFTPKRYGNPYSLSSIGPPFYIPRPSIYVPPGWYEPQEDW